MIEVEANENMSKTIDISFSSPNEKTAISILKLQVIIFVGEFLSELFF